MALESDSSSDAKEAATLGEELANLMLAPQPDVKRISQIAQRLHELGLKARKAALESARAAAKKNADPSKAKEGAGPPSRKYLPSIKSLQSAASQAPKEKQAGYVAAEQNLMQAMVTESSRRIKNAHMLPIGLPLIDPLILGQQIEQFARSEHDPKASTFADWLGADLSGKNLDGVNLQGAFFDGANLEGASFIGANLENVTLVGANLTNTNFNKANLKGANLGCANLHHTNLSEANLQEVIFDKASFHEANCQGANMSKASFMALQVVSAKFTNANLTESKWLGINLEPDLEKVSVKMPHLDEAVVPMEIGGIDFTGANLLAAIMLGCVAENGIQMTKANLTRASLLKCHFNKGDFSGAQFSSTNVVLGSSMKHCNFTGAKMTASFFRETNFSQGNFHQASLDKSHFGLANMTNCSLIKALASGANFERANLTNATFLASQLVGGVFRHATLTGTCFDDSDLTHADFSQAKSSGASPTFVNANLSRALLPASMSKK